MAIFGQRPWVNPLAKISIFRLFSTFCYYSVERRFFFLEFHKSRFPGLYCLKKKLAKVAIFGPKPWVNPFAKMSIFRLFRTSSLYSLERRFFVLVYHKSRFSGVNCLIKNNWKIGHFWKRTMG